MLVASCALYVMPGHLLGLRYGVRVPVAPHLVPPHGSFSPPAQGLTVPQYASEIVRKYMRHEFAGNDQKNLEIASEEVFGELGWGAVGGVSRSRFTSLQACVMRSWAKPHPCLYQTVLMQKLVVATGNKSEDSKAPFKAIRNAIDQTYFNGDGGSSVDELFALYTQLERICWDRLRQGQDPQGPSAVLQILRYRLIRLVTGDTWEKQAELRLGVLRLIHGFAEAHAQAVVHGAPVGNPTASAQGAMKGLARSLSYGSRRSGGLHGAEFWAEALEEIYKAPGAKLPALLRLVLTHDARTPAVAPNAGAAGAGRATSLASTSPTSPPRPLTSHVSVQAAPSQPTRDDLPPIYNLVPGSWSPDFSQMAGSPDAAPVPSSNGHGGAPAPADDVFSSFQGSGELRRSVSGKEDRPWYLQHVPAGVPLRSPATPTPPVSPLGHPSFSAEAFAAPLASAGSQEGQKWVSPTQATFQDLVQTSLGDALRPAPPPPVSQTGGAGPA
ncbi:hypothetical protein F751_0741 [Auxenochlorella protothecoides]|uniref:Uncharacterized protein n=1 Tax=Auxenochlorella protothecoides TaxID=3075 RepID=A0A087SM55_AUXPR|nr:hypothetical protein F751_0741 [Auxenochlorella protothecoides]KFM26809.1 hypothetical protein F751_0741 [Auxenochlorella protothecoides]